MINDTPMINRVAMTGAERIRRYRERKKAAAELAAKKAAERKQRAANRHAKPVELVKPSNNWNFPKLAFARLPDNDDPHGYIPGDLYANALYYWSRPGDVVVAPMAGSGQILQVYERRHLWMKPEPWELEIHASDLVPRGDYRHLIERRDVLNGLPCPADLVIADVPYFGISKRIYSDSPDDLGNMDFEAYSFAVKGMAAISARALKPGGRVVIITASTYVDHARHRRILLDELVREAFASAGMHLVDKAFSPRHIQQSQNGDMARANKLAREHRTMLCDMAVALCFSRAAADLGPSGRV